MEVRKLECNCIENKTIENGKQYHKGFLPPKSSIFNTQIPKKNLNTHDIDQLFTSLNIRRNR